MPLFPGIYLSSSFQLVHLLFFFFFIIHVWLTGYLLHVSSCPGDLIIWSALSFQFLFFSNPMLYNSLLLTIFKNALCICSLHIFQGYYNFPYSFSKRFVWFSIIKILYLLQTCNLMLLLTIISGFSQGIIFILQIITVIITEVLVFL